DEGLKAKRENFDNFYFKEDAIVFVYNPYQLTAWSMGDHHLEITFDELKKLFPTEIKLLEFIDTVSTK
ncbi:MAG TPA: RsiV family protein, partial [Bacteroidia bacterium]|nr:RsiV family protein [Bacteroidia bacterium]